ncbi:MAG: hypothetical protein ACI30I_04475 [Parabacteroides sp.]
MKKFFLWASALCVYFTSCQSSNSEPAEPDEPLYPVQFTLQLNEEVLPFSPTKSMPDLTFTEPSLRADEGEEEETPSTPAAPPSMDDDELYNTIEYIVYRKVEGNVYAQMKHKTYKQGETSDDFGVIYDKLPAGDYKFAFITHSSTSTTLSGTTMTFSEISDTFWKFMECSVSALEATAETPVLSRVIGRVEFCSTDNVPAEMASFEITVSPFLNQLDVQTGRAVETVASTYYSFPITAGEQGATRSYQFNTFVSESSRLSLVLSTKTSSGTVLFSRTVTQVAPQANQTLRYTGILHTDKGNDSFELDVNEQWNSDADKELPDPNEEQPDPGLSE